jgi:hypothetical protein
MAINDDDWFEAMRGKAPKRREDQREAEQLRTVIAAAEEKPPVTNGRGLERLLFRLRQERLLAPPPGRFARVVPFAVAAMLVLGIAVTWFVPLHQRSADGEVLRGGERKILRVSDPRATADRVVSILRTHNVTATVRPLEDGIELVATVEAEAVPAVSSELRTMGIALPSSGILHIDLVRE